MSLLDTVEQDNAFLLEDDVLGFARAITFTEEDGVTVHEVKGLYTRIAVTTDPGTGLQVRTDKSAVTVRLLSLEGSTPRAGWTVTTTDVTGAVVTGKISSTDDDVYPDRTLGRVTVLFKVASAAARYDIDLSAGRFRRVAGAYQPVAITATARNKGVLYSGRWRVRINDGPVVYSSAANEGSKSVTLGLSPFATFGAGFPGWVLGDGARVRSQGWVLGMPTADDTMSTTVSATAGSKGVLIIAYRRGTTDATNRRIKIRWGNAGGSNIGELGYTFTAVDGPGWVLMVLSGDAPAGTAQARINVDSAVGYTSGIDYVGMLYATVDGVVINANWDFSDGAAGWTSLTTQTFTYDPTTAYLGNSYDGTARDTLAITSGEATALSWPSSQGKTYRVQADLKQITFASGRTGRVGLVWLDGLGAEISREGVAVTNSDAAWVSRTGDFSAPAGTATAKVAAWVEGTASGAFLVGQQAEIHEVVSGEVVGTKSVTFELYEAGGFTSKVRTARAVQL